MITLNNYEGLSEIIGLVATTFALDESHEVRVAAQDLSRKMSKLSKKIRKEMFDDMVEWRDQRGESK